jgi:hypothetical protein
LSFGQADARLAAGLQTAVSVYRDGKSAGEGMNGSHADR